MKANFTVTAREKGSETSFGFQSARHARGFLRDQISFLLAEMKDLQAQLQAIPEYTWVPGESNVVRDSLRIQAEFVIPLAAARDVVVEAQRQYIRETYEWIPDQTKEVQISNLQRSYKFERGEAWGIVMNALKRALKVGVGKIYSILYDNEDEFLKNVRVRVVGLHANGVDVVAVDGGMGNYDHFYLDFRNISLCRKADG